MTEASTTSGSVSGTKVIPRRLQRLDCLVMTDRSWSQRQDLLQPHIGARFRKLRLHSSPGQCRKVGSAARALAARSSGRYMFIRAIHTL